MQSKTQIKSELIQIVFKNNMLEFAELVEYVMKMKAYDEQYISVLMEETSILLFDKLMKSRRRLANPTQ